MATKKQTNAVTKKQDAGAVAIPDGIDIVASAQQANNETIGMQDQVFPWLKVVQKNSPELDDDANFPGLSFGDLFLATGETWEGKSGLVCVPFYYGRTYVEWRPRASGGGFQADHGLTDGSELAKTCTRAENKKVATVLPNGNDLIETAYWAIFIIDPEDASVKPIQSIFAMSSTFLSVSKEWNTKIIKYRLGGAPNYIRWARPWTVTTERESNDAGVWALPKVSLYKPEKHDGPFHTFDLPNGVELWKECDRMSDVFKSGFRLQGDASDTPADNEGAENEGDAPY